MSEDDKYIVHDIVCWAGDIDYPIFSVLSENEYNEILEYLNTKSDEELLEWETEYCLGSNQWIELNLSKIKKYMVNARIISGEDLAVISKYIRYSCFIDIFEDWRHDFGWFDSNYDPEDTKAWVPDYYNNSTVKCRPYDQCKPCSRDPRS